MERQEWVRTSYYSQEISPFLRPYVTRVYISCRWSCNLRLLTHAPLLCCVSFPVFANLHFRSISSLDLYFVFLSTIIDRVHGHFIPPGCRYVLSESKRLQKFGLLVAKIGRERMVDTIKIGVQLHVEVRGMPIAMISCVCTYMWYACICACMYACIYVCMHICRWCTKAYMRGVISYRARSNQREYHHPVPSPPIPLSSFTLLSTLTLIPALTSSSSRNACTMTARRETTRTTQISLALLVQFVACTGI